MEEKERIENLENNILNEQAVIEKERQKLVDSNIGEEIIAGRKEKVLRWFKDPLNLSLVLVLVLAFVIRIYYFIMTKSQPLWWDELCYGSLAKNFIYHTWDGTSLITGETAIRPLIFSFLWSILLFFNFGEIVNRFLLVMLPSFVSVFLIYLLGKEVFNKKIGIMSAFIFGVIWLNIFYSSRFLVHMLELCLIISSLLFFAKATKGEINFKNFCISLVLLSFATLTRYQDGMMFFVYFVILIIGKKLYLNKKKFWYAGLIGLVPLLLFFVMNYITQGNIFPALLGGTYLRPVVEGNSAPFAFYLFKFIPTFLQTLFFIFFLIGFIYLAYEIVISYNFLAIRNKERNVLMLVLMTLAFYSFLIFYLKGGEDRWLFEILIALVLISAYGIEFCGRIISKYSKILAFIFVLTVLLIGAYTQVIYADGLIKNKKESYLQMKDAFEWIKENTPKESIIAGNGIEPYAVYYADRRYLLLNNNESEIANLSFADYFVVEGFSPQPSYFFSYLTEHNDTLKLVKYELYNQELIIGVYEILKNKTVTNF